MTPQPGHVARQLLRRAVTPGPDGVVSSINPETAGWEYTALTVYRLRPGQAAGHVADDKERLILVLEGHADAWAGGRDLGDVGSRATVFDGPPCPVLLVAPGDGFELVARTAALVCVASAPGGPIALTKLVSPGDVLVEARGSGNTARRIHHLLPPAAEAGRLIAFEVFTPGGNWSSYPPHKHDTEDPPRSRRASRSSTSTASPSHRASPSSASTRRTGASTKRWPPRRLRRRARPGGLPPGRRTGRLRLLLPERHGRPEPRLALHGGPGPRLADELESGRAAARPGMRRRQHDDDHGRQPARSGWSRRRRPTTGTTPAPRRS
jgi:hypothetical protein